MSGKIIGYVLKIITGTLVDYIEIILYYGVVADY